VTTDLGQLLAGLGGSAGSNPPRLIAVGWATVDLERTITGLADVEVHPADDEVLLGARARLVDVAPVRVVLLEPFTEGRLAAALARRGEGIVALYLASEEPLDGHLRPTALGVPGRLMAHDRPWGPFVIRVPG
jgi:hypothetical protein